MERPAAVGDALLLAAVLLAVALLAAASGTVLGALGAALRFGLFFVLAAAALGAIARGRLSLLPFLFAVIALALAAEIAWELYLPQPPIPLDPDTCYDKQGAYTC